MPEIFDTHAHYDDEAFDEDRDEIFGRFAACGIGRVVDPGSTRESLAKIVLLAHRWPFLYGALGIHPSECAGMTEDWIEDIRARLHPPAEAQMPGQEGTPGHDPKLVAIGEIGLDYHWEEPARKEQQHWFRRQIQLAREEGLPIIVHSRDAAADTLRILKEEKAAEAGAVIHCYSYSAELAQEFVKLGFYIGIGGVVTFKNGRKMKETAAAVPVERILLETDSPYLAPVPYRGKRNTSLYLPQVVSALAAIRGMSEEEVIRQTGENAERFYRLPPA